MLASWIAYASLVSSAFAVAGLALERVAMAKRWPLRWIWAGALATSVAWPVAYSAARAIPAPPEPVTAALPFTITIAPIQIAADQPSGVAIRAGSIDRWLAFVWAVSSGVLMLRLAHGAATIRRRRRTWRRGHVDGVAVHVSTDDGPAVVGVRPMDIVLPEWILSLDARLRALVLRHEEEHRAAKDPRLLLLATMAVALLPWNLALWFIGRRLRLAIEMDCDARVLRAHPSPERYGLLMLTVAQRRSSAPMLAATMLSESTTQLEQRIIAMQATRRLARRTVSGALAVAVAVVAFACSLRTAPPSQAVASTNYDSVVAAYMSAAGFRSWSLARAAAGNPAPRYPDQLRRDHVGGWVLAQFAVDTSGRPDMATFRMRESTHELFTEAVRSNLPNMRFVPAEADGKKVKQVIQMPFQFGIADQFPTMTAPDNAHRTVSCAQGGDCPVHRLSSVVVTAAP